MKPTITAYKRTPEVECCEAFLRLHNGNYITETGPQYIANIGGSGRPVITLDGKELKGFDELYHHIHDHGLCSI